MKHDKVRNKQGLQSFSCIIWRDIKLSPSGKVELSSVAASNSDDMDPTMTASGASLSSTSIFVTLSVKREYPEF